MRTTIALTLLLAVSCSQIQESSPSVVNISVSGCTSRVTGSIDDGAVSSLLAYVFREDGSLETSGSSHSSDIPLAVESGHKTIVAIANSPHPENTGNLEGLRSSISLLADNSPDALVMYGEQDIEIHSDTDVNVEIKRLAAKIAINRIYNRLASGYRDKELVIEKIFLINVAGSTLFSGYPTVQTVWLNKRALSTSECPVLLYDSADDTTIPYKGCYETRHSFYCYRNPTEEDTSQEEWCPRFTRLVVQAKLGGQRTWYPISIPDIRQNCIYEITELTITRPGSDSPDKPVTAQEIEINLCISPWGDGNTEEITI